MSRWSDLPLRGKALIAIALPLVILLSSLVLIYLAERQTARAEEDVRRVLLVKEIFKRFTPFSPRQPPANVGICSPIAKTSCQPTTARGH